MSSASAVTEKHTHILPARLESGLSRSQLPALDGIRAVAAYLVVYYHFGLPVSGGLGVLVFFVLSGFLITWLLLKEDDKRGVISLRHFYARRSLRIFPAFYCYWMSIILLMMLRGKEVVWPQAWASFFYVNNYYQAIAGDPNTGLSHTWSLGVEEQFYLLWPGVFLWFRRDRRKMLRVLTGFILAVWMYRYLGRVYLGIPQGYVYEAFDMRADHLAIGCWIALALRTGSFARLWTILCSRVWLPGITILLLALSNLAWMQWGSWYRDTVSFIADPVLAGALIVQLIAFHESPVWTLFNSAPVQYLGRISYSVYLYQQLTVEPVRKLLSGLPLIIQVVGVGAVVALVASAFYWFVEKPFLRWKERFAVK